MGNSTSSLPYSVGKVVSDEKWYGFSIHEGTQKADGTAVTVFRANKKDLSEAKLLPHVTNCQFLYPPSLHHMKTSLKLVHPFLLKVHSIIDTDAPTVSPPDFSNSTDVSSSTGEWIIVTEHVMTVQEYLRDLVTEQERQDGLAWGLYGLIQALHFLHNDVKAAHGNVQPSSIFVTPAGDFKLSGFHLFTEIGISNDNSVGPTRHFQEYERDVTPKAYRCPERLQAQWHALTELPPHVMDSYSLGVLLEELYGDRLPAALQKAVRRLQTPHGRMRPRLKPLEKCPLLEKNDFVTAMKQFSFLLTQSTSEQVHFLSSVKLQTKVFSKAHCIYKIYPTLLQLLFHTLHTHTNTEGLLQLNDDLSRRLVIICINLLFTIMELFLEPEEEQYWTLLVQPLIQKLFPMADRGIRGALLQRISLLEKGFRSQPKSINTMIFEPMCSGFTDSSAPLRELTLTSCTSLVQHLTPANRDKLSRYLIRLQSDPQSSIRTNAMIFIGKMLTSDKSSSKEKMEKLLLPAFTRAIHDDFLPCRLASLKTMYSIRTQISPQLLAQKVVPLIVPHTLDPSSQQVRMESWKVVDALTTILRQESQRLDMISTTNDTNDNSTSGTANTTNNTSAKFSTNAANNDTNIENNSGTGSGYLSSWGLSWGASSTAPTTTPTATDAIPTMETKMTTLTTNNVSSINNGMASDNGWSDDDDNWGDDDDVPIKPVALKTSVPTSMKLKKSNNDTKANIQKLSTGNLNMSGWDDF